MKKSCACKARELIIPFYLVWIDVQFLVPHFRKDVKENGEDPEASVENEAIEIQTI